MIPREYTDSTVSHFILKYCAYIIMTVVYFKFIPDKYDVLFIESEPIMTDLVIKLFN